VERSAGRGLLRQGYSIERVAAVTGSVAAASGTRPGGCSDEELVAVSCLTARPENRQIPIALSGGMSENPAM